MRRWPKYLGCTLILLVWLFFVTLPFFAFTLAARQEIAVGGAQNHIRVFLLQEKESEGIGLEITRPFSGTPSCTTTSVNYFMWVGEPQNVTYCLCGDVQNGQAQPAPCPPS